MPSAAPACCRRISRRPRSDGSSDRAAPIGTRSNNRHREPHNGGRALMGLTEPERLPPPPFWRTRYFAFDIMARRDYLDPIEIQRIIRRPERRQVQADGRIRLWGYAA